MSDDEFAAYAKGSGVTMEGVGGFETADEMLRSAQDAAKKMGLAEVPNSFDVGLSPETSAEQSPSGIPVELGPAAWNDIASETEDWDQRLIPTRWGDYSNFGYKKIVAVHQMTDTDVIEAPYHGLVDKIEGNKFTYYGIVTVNGYPQTPLTSIATMSFESSVYGMTGDGKVLGTLTAFCNNNDTQLCPDYIP